MSDNEIREAYNKAYRPYSDETWFPFEDGFKAAWQHCEAKALEQSALQQAKIDELTKELNLAEDAGWHNFDNLQHITNHLISKDALLIVHETDDDPLNFSKNLCASFDAMQAKIDEQTKRANALALVIQRLTKVVTSDHENKEAFIGRIKSILSEDPDLAVCELQAKIDSLQEANRELERLCDRTYVQFGADAYNHCCEVFETWRRKRQKSTLPTHDWESGLYDSLNWLQDTVEELEADLAKARQPVSDAEIKEIASYWHLDSDCVRSILERK